MLVYLITNKVNGKRYVGITTTSVDLRWYQHCWLAANGGSQALYRAIRKHGADRFQVETIDTADNLEDLLAKERLNIERLGTFTKKGNGYNMTLGGDGVFGFEFSDETRAQMAASALARFSDPEERERQRKRQERYWTESARALQAAKIAQVHAANPEQARLHSEFMKQHCDPEEMRRRSRLLWDAPGSRERHKERQTAYWSEDANRQKRSREIKARFADNPQYAKNISAAKKRQHEERPKIGANHSEFMKKRYAESPAVAEQYRASALQAYAKDPTLRTRQGQSRKKFYASNPAARQKAAVVAQEKAAERSALRERLLGLASAYERASGKTFTVPTRSEGGWQTATMLQLIAELEAMPDSTPEDTDSE